ncbi:cupin domain-containing protein [Phyllobacterium brassicacearum]|uniref:Cupin domain-containing protein n=1 Tax=Phyllobacterium brassicacearum TaxID=314235 RepID=A0A2P7BEA6_9HYPH|nr:cupin domain-containing protein [Phyllobacterium brassicacearum]PSH64755.1 cupin domain-containing protein [Phyllobacterium brassicacearum]TDQ21728.1 hypothetical protein DEV91_1195 [Phyllobacterium brassicacearum]
MARRSLSKQSVRDDNAQRSSRDVIFLQREEGRRYDLGRLTGIFKADEADTDGAYSVSEWILESGLQGVGEHKHDENDEVFYVLEGAPEVLVGECWRRFQPGTFLRIPAGVVHDFRNNGEKAARLLNLFIPGGFERNMPKISAWFAAQKEA